MSLFSSINHSIFGKTLNKRFMKNFFALVTMILLGLSGFAQPYTWYGNAAGIWTNPNTWIKPAGAPPTQFWPSTSDDIVIIKDVFPVLANFDITIKSLTIDTEVGYCQLIVNDGVTITISDDLSVLSSGIFDAQLLFSGSAIVNVGDSSEDGITVEGTVTTTGNSKLTSGGYFYHNSGKVSFSGNFELDISTAGAIPSLTDKYNFYIGPDATYEFGTGVVDLTINVFNGNLGAKEEVYLNNATIINNSDGGQLILGVFNTDGGVSNYSMLTDLNLGEVNIDIGTGNKLLFDNLSDPPSGDVFFKGLNVISGEFEMATGSLLTIDPASDGL